MTNTHKDHRAGKPVVFEQVNLALGGDDFGIRQSTLSSALASVFRGKFCDVTASLDWAWLHRTRQHSLNT